MDKEINLTLFADYFQFYLQDEAVDGDLSGSWTQEATDMLLAIAPGTIGIGTVRNMDVPVSIRIFEKEPPMLHDSVTIHQINECDLDVASGKIVAAGCTDYFPEARRIEVAAGIYRARIYYHNLDKLSKDGLDGDDSYEIHLWPTNIRQALAVMKWRPAGG